MNIKILIDRIILEQGNFSPRQLRLMQANIETELAHLLTVNGIPPKLQLGGKVTDLSVNLHHFSVATHPTKLGQDIAQAIYREL
jgi:hypothetical protein